MLSNKKQENTRQMLKNCGCSLSLSIIIENSKINTLKSGTLN